MTFFASIAVVPRPGFRVEILRLSQIRSHRKHWIERTERASRFNSGERRRGEAAVRGAKTHLRLADISGSIKTFERFKTGRN